jgi:PIN like domain
MTEKSPTGLGIYHDFPGYRLPLDNELDAALQAALVVIDANVLLNLYRYNESTRDDLLEVLARLGGRLWIPNQVLREFWRNRLAVMASRGAGTDQALTALSKQQRATSDTIKQWAKTIAIETSDRDRLLDRVTDLYAELESEIRKYAPAAPTVVSSTVSEPVLRQLEKLLEGKVGAALSEADWQEAVKEGNDRAKRGEPPGYMDVDKEGSALPEGAAGDYLVWHQTVDEATRRGIDVLLVTGDEKEDWWWRHRSEFLGPRIELVAEFKNRCGRQLYMMRPVDLLRRASALDVIVRKESVDDVERVSRESQARPEWSATGVAALLERLENEGWSQAEVVRVAASRGGTIDREAVYEI